MIDRLAELHECYVKQLDDIENEIEFEKDYFINVVKKFITLYEKEKAINNKLEEIQIDINRLIVEEVSNAK